MQKFQIKDELPQQRLGEELMIFDHAADKVHVLNATSTHVWECLRNGSSMEDTAKSLGEAYRVGPEQDVISVVRTALEQLSERGLVVRVGADTEA